MRRAVAGYVLRVYGVELKKTRKKNDVKTFLPRNWQLATRNRFHKIRENFVGDSVSLGLDKKANFRYNCHL